MIVKGGRALYGQAVGILLFDGRRYPVPGDVANASSYDFPVRLKVVKGLFDVPEPPDRWVDRKPPEGACLLRDAAISLRDEGVRAIVTACGFFVGVQDLLAGSAGVPVFTSPLICVPLLSRMVGNRKIGIVTASKSLLDSAFLHAAGITDAMDVVIEGIEESHEFYATHMGGKRTDMDVDLLRNEIVGIAKRFSRGIRTWPAFCSNARTCRLFRPKSCRLPGCPYSTSSPSPDSSTPAWCKSRARASFERDLIVQCIFASVLLRSAAMASGGAR